jgi:hypothetical protein
MRLTVPSFGSWSPTLAPPSWSWRLRSPSPHTASITSLTNTTSSTGTSNTTSSTCNSNTTSFGLPLHSKSSSNSYIYSFPDTLRLIHFLHGSYNLNTQIITSSISICYNPQSGSRKININEHTIKVTTTLQPSHSICW